MTEMVGQKANKFRCQLVYYRTENSGIQCMNKISPDESESPERNDEEK